MEYEIPVSLPFGDNERYDMIIERNGKLEKIQVKYSSEMYSKNSIVFKISSSTCHTNNKNIRGYKDDVDAFILYNGINDELYYIPINLIGDNKTISIRINSSNARNQKEIYLREEFLLENFLNEENFVPKLISEQISSKKNTCIDCGIEIYPKSTRCAKCETKRRKQEREKIIDN